MRPHNRAFGAWARLPAQPFGISVYAAAFALSQYSTGHTVAVWVIIDGGRHRRSPISW